MVVRSSPRAHRTCCCSTRSTARSNIDVNVVGRHASSRCCSAPSRHTRRVASRLPAARRCAGGRRLRDLRPADDAGADAWAAASHGFTLDHELRRVHADAPAAAAMPARHQRVRDQRRQQPLLGAAGAALRRRMPGRHDGRAASDFNMRWIASLVAEAHRILMRGGVFLYPRDHKDPSKPGRLRLLYEANPIGAADRAGRRPRQHRAASRMLDVQPERAAPARRRWCSARSDEVESASSATTTSDDSGADSPSSRRCSTAHACSAQIATSATARYRMIRGRCRAEHPIIAITGSSGAGTTTGDAARFANIFRREGVEAAVIEGDAFPPLTTASRCASACRPQADRARPPPLQPLRPREQPVRRSCEQLFAQLRRDRAAAARAQLPARRRRGRAYSQRARHVHCRGDDVPADTDLLFYEGLHGGCGRRRGRRRAPSPTCWSAWCRSST